MTIELGVIAVLVMWLIVLSVKMYGNWKNLEQDAECNRKYLSGRIDDAQERYWKLDRELDMLLDHLGVEIKDQRTRVLVKK